MPEPLTSGRTWSRDPEGNFRAEEGITADLQWLRDDDDRHVTAVFKSTAREHAYSMGVERVVYALGDGLGLPLPACYLERFDGSAGVVHLRVPNSLRWRTAGSCPMLMDEVTNRDTWPLSVVFDLWVANHDRHPGNILVQPVPPEARPAHAVRCTTWLIDHGNCGLWWPWKFENGLRRAEEVNVGDGTMMAGQEDRLREQMPEDYRLSFADLDTGGRTPFLDQIRAVTDDEISEAVMEVPSHYFSAESKRRTLALLKARRDRIEALATNAFPVR